MWIRQLLWHCLFRRAAPADDPLEPIPYLTGSALAGAERPRFVGASPTLLDIGPFRAP
jgi:hypothetical protein